MKISDMIVSALLKKGVLYEARNIDTDVEIPIVVNDQDKQIRVNIKCDHMSIRIEKD